VTFGSAAHDPLSIGREFARAAALAEAGGFTPGRDQSGMWLRR
jgi:histidinol-phosphatase (PHP family)